ncbi:MAG: radical SAM protein [Armatimonadetes bacterium]|nr:radical SAM protein [Armatimonadota bacterium]
METVEKRMSDDPLSSILVSRSQDLSITHRGRKTLLVDPESASWAVVPKEYAAVLEALRRPLPFPVMTRRLRDFSEDSLKDLLARFFQHGMVRINGEGFFDKQELWPIPDDPPYYPFSVYLHSTDACNFRCKYCYAEAEGKGKRMTFETAKDILDRLLRELPGEFLSVEFHGGEPLLIKKTIYRIVEYGFAQARKWKKQIKFRMQTNGSLLDEEFISFAKKHRMEIGVSLDGGPALHDENRIYPNGKGTFEKVWEKVKLARSMGLRVGFLGVIDSPENYVKAFEFFTSRGVFRFKLNYNSPLGRATDNFEFPESLGERYARGLLGMVDLALEFNTASPVPCWVPDVNFFVEYLQSKERRYMCMRSPCGVGRSLLAFGCRGEIYPCEEMSSTGNFQCGNIYDEDMTIPEMVDSSTVISELRSRRIEKIPKCSVCTWRRFCGGRCLNKSFHYYGTIMREDPMCSFYSTLFEELMWKMDEHSDLARLTGRP